MPGKAVPEFYQLSLPKKMNLDVCTMTEQHIREFKRWDSHSSVQGALADRNVYESLCIFKYLQRRLIGTWPNADRFIWLRTFNHSLEVAAISEFVAKALKLPEHFQVLLWNSCALHDIGKCMISAAICGYTGSLRDRPIYWQEMKKHPEYGAAELLRSPMPAIYAVVANFHHKFLDGMGYPKITTSPGNTLCEILSTGLYWDLLFQSKLTVGDAVKMITIVHVSDVLAALYADRSYRNGMPIERAFMEGIREFGLSTAEIKEFTQNVGDMLRGEGEALDELIARLCQCENQCRGRDISQITEIQKKIYCHIIGEILCRRLAPRLYCKLAMGNDLQKLRGAQLRN